MPCWAAHLAAAAAFTSATTLQVGGRDAESQVFGVQHGRCALHRSSLMFNVSDGILLVVRSLATKNNRGR